MVEFQSDSKKSKKHGHHHHEKFSKKWWSSTLRFFLRVLPFFLLCELFALIWCLIFFYVFEPSSELADLFPIYDFTAYIFLPLIAILGVLASLQTFTFYHLNKHVSTLAANAQILKRLQPSMRTKVDNILVRVEYALFGADLDARDTIGAILNESAGTNDASSPSLMVKLLENAFAVQSCLVILEMRPLYRIAEILCFLYGFSLPWILWHPFKWFTLLIMVPGLVPVLSFLLYSSLFRKNRREHDRDSYLWTHLSEIMFQTVRT